MIRYTLLSLLTAALLGGCAQPKAATPDPKPEPSPPKTVVRTEDQGQGQQEEALLQIALLLDTSGSMDGLIEQAKTQLWRIVNEFAASNRNGKPVRLQVALYEYGKDSLASQDGYLRRIVPLTSDLDKVSEELFALRTNGGEEYCGWVIRSALKELEWSQDKADLRLIFVAGNEPFNQGPVGVQAVCEEALQRGIVVNSIYCGSPQDGDAAGWKDGAALAQGRFLIIDHNQQVAHVDAPQDQEIAKLNAELNETYVPYGAAGEAGMARQQAQDANAAGVSPSVASYRASVKASKQYSNAQWDLVDAVKEGKVEVTELEEEALPEELKNASVEERRTIIVGKQKKREDLQKRIKELSAERQAYIDQKAKEAGAQTLDSAMVEAIKEQAAEKGYSVE